MISVQMRCVGVHTFDKSTLSLLHRFAQEKCWNNGCRMVNPNNQNNGMTKTIVNQCMQDTLKIRDPTFKNRAFQTVLLLISKKLNAKFHNVTSNYRQDLKKCKSNRNVIPMLLPLLTALLLPNNSLKLQLLHASGPEKS